MAGAKRPPGRPRLADLSVPTDVSIITAAANLFMDMGYRAVTMEMVAEAAGVTKAAVYYHFSDKATLFVAAAHHVFDRARSATERLLAQPGSLRGRLLEIAKVVLALPRPFTEFDAMMHEATLDLSPEQITDIHAQERSVDEVIEQACFTAAQRGEIRAPDPMLAAHGFLALLRVGQARDEEGNPRLPDTLRTADVLIDMLWGGIDVERAAQQR